MDETPLSNAEVHGKTPSGEPLAGYEIFRRLVQAVDEYAIFALNPNGEVMTWNAGAERLKGYKAEEIVGSHFRRFYTKEDRDRLHPEYELVQALKNGKYEEEGWRVRKDGTQFWANIVITAIRDENGKIQGFGKVTRDLTERRNAELALKESEERFRLMVEGVEDYAIFMLDPQGHISTWNRGAERNKGYSPSEIIGKHFSTFYGPEDVAAGKPAWELVEAVKQGRFEDEGWRYRKDGSKFWANVIITPIYNEAHQLLGFAKITRDLSERRKAEEALQTAYHDLEQRIQDRTRELSEAKVRAEDALVIRDRFFSIASHELKTPLAALKLYIQMRRRNVRKGRLEEFAPEHLEELCTNDERQVNRLVALVDRLLDISRLTTETYSFVADEFDIVEMVSDTVSRMSGLLEQSGNVCAFKAPSKIEGVWDRLRLEQVLTNLLANAGKYAAGKPVEVSVVGSDDGVEIRVQDRGPGISVADQAYIFEPFGRIAKDNDAEGLGLGLYITKKIIESHGGRLTPESEIGHGSTFIVSLPRISFTKDEGHA